jgi:hypothetical protein
MSRLFAPLLGLGVVVACSSSAPVPATPDEPIPLPPTRAEQAEREGDAVTDRTAPAGDESLHVFGMTPKSGPATGGTAIKIRGANFQTAESVKVMFNKAEGTVTRMIDDEIVVQAPPGIAGQSVDIVLIFEPGAARLPLPEGYTYTAE